MSRMKWLRQAAAAGVLLLGTAGVVTAKPVLQEDFRDQVPGRKGGEIVSSDKGFSYRGPGGNNEKSGSYVEYDLQQFGFNAAQGTVELDVTRGEVDPIEALFSFADESGERVFSVMIEWEGGMGFGDQFGAVIRAMTPGAAYWTTRSRGDLGNAITLPFASIGRVPRGATIHVAVTWDAGGVKFFVDGKALSGEPAEQAKLMQNLARARKFIIGAQTSTRIPGGAWSMTRSLLANVQLHDRVLGVSEFAQPIAPKGVNIFGVEHNASTVAGFSGKLVAGNTLGVTVTGTPGSTGTFDVVHYPDVNANISLDWRGWGVYLEEKSFFAEGEVNLRDVDGYEVYVAQAPFDYATPGFEPVAKLEVETQQYLVEAPAVDTPYYVAVVAVMRDQTRRAVVAPISGRTLAETAPGVYTGSYQVGWQDRYPRATVVAHLGSGEASAQNIAATTLAIDPSLTIAMAASPSELMADEKSTAKVTVTVTDANGNPVPEHEIKFQLFTTSQYTGVVGGGAFAEQVGATVKESSWGKTDLFGKVTATYVAGFAAKTAVIVARDMLSNDTGTAWVKTFIKATAQLELVPAEPTAAMDAGYAITVTSSDEWLTADGKSQARITARVTLNDQPVEGHKVAFAVSSGTGTVRAVKDTTDRNGEARALYTAGTKIGMVLVTATDTTAGISGSVQIELRSDAPAKIVLKIDPETLPADGRSTAQVNVLVTDINDNPNDNVEVEYALTEGGGRLQDDKSITDRNGETSTEYVAGRSAGRVSIEITVRSTVPTAEELAKVRDMALAVKDYDFF